MSIVRLNYFEAKAGSEAELLAFLEIVVKHIRQFEGCISCQLLKSLENAAYFAVAEEWRSREDHEASAAAIAPEQLQQVMLLLERAPSGHYYTKE